MICEKCGEEILGEATFCPGCGNVITAAKVEPEPVQTSAPQVEQNTIPDNNVGIPGGQYGVPSKKNNKVAFIVIGILVAVIIGLVVAITTGVFDKKKSDSNSSSSSKGAKVILGEWEFYSYYDAEEGETDYSMTGMVMEFTEEEYIMSMFGVDIEDEWEFSSEDEDYYYYHIYDSGASATARIAKDNPDELLLAEPDESGYYTFVRY